MSLLKRQLITLLQVTLARLRMGAQMALMFLALARYEESATLHMDEIFQDGQCNMTWRDMT